MTKKHDLLVKYIEQLEKRVNMLEQLLYPKNTSNQNETVRYIDNQDEVIDCKEKVPHPFSNTRRRFAM